MNEDIKFIEDSFNNILHRCNLNSKVSVKEVKRWMQELDFWDKWTPVSMLTGLLDYDIIDEYKLVDELIKATIKLNLVLSIPSLDGKSFTDVLKKRREENIPTLLRAGQRIAPPRQWCESYVMAITHMHRKQFNEAAEKFNETFQTLLELQTTDPEIYRIFCNAGLAYLFAGDPVLGYECISIAEELNPNYTFASQQLQKIEQGEYKTLVTLGHLMRMKKNMDKWMDKQDHLNLDIVMGWSEKKILKILSTYGVTIDKDEFIRVARTVNNPDDIAKKLFYPHSCITPEDEDFLWMAACALWEKYCPDEHSIYGLIDCVHDSYEYALNIDLANQDEKTLSEEEKQQLQIYLQKIKDYVFTKKKNLIHEWMTMLDVEDNPLELREFLTLLLSISSFKDQVLSIVSYLIEHEPDPYWYHITIVNTLNQDELKGIKLFETIQKKYPYYCYLAGDLCFYHMDQNKFDDAERYLMDALAIVDTRAKEKKYTIDNTHSTIYEDYTYVLDLFESLYKKKKTDGKQKKRLTEKRKQIEKNKEELSYSPQSEKMNKALEKIIFEHDVEKASQSAPIHYYEFLSQFNIDFRTDDPVETKENHILTNGNDVISSMDKEKKKSITGYSGKKIGRNDPCPCGSGKKYKKCCGFITKK